MSWTLVFIIVVLVAAAIGFKVLEARQPKSTTSYRQLGTLLTPAERSFYGVLLSVVGDGLQIFAKVRVADVIAPAKGLDNSERQRAFNRISAKHFDFVLCKPGDLSVVCGLELDDKSHSTKKRKDRDEFLQGACDSAGLPLVRFRAKSAYTRADIEEALATYLPKQIAPPVKPEASSDVCPKCGSNLVKRVAKKGTRAGQEFMACSGYPKCRYILAT